MKGVLRAILNALDQGDNWLEHAVFRMKVVLLGLRVGNVYAPEWAPNTRDRIVELDACYVTYKTYSPVPDRVGDWVEDGCGRDPSPFYWWLSHTFKQYYPPGATGLTLL